MAQWTNLALQSCNVGSGSSPWQFIAGPLAVTSATSIIPGQTAYKHQGISVASSGRFQAVGTLSAAAETATMVIENVDALVSRLAIRDVTAAAWVNLSDFTWATGSIALNNTAAGTSASATAVSLGTGPTGGELYQLSVTATPSNPGNTRQVYLYPVGSTANTLSAIIHATGLYEAATYAPAHIITGASSETWRIVDLDDYAVREAPVRWQDLATYRRRFSGKMSSATRSASAAVRVWQVNTSFTLTEAEGDALEDDLLATGHVYATGEVIHDTVGVAVECDAQAVQRRDGPLDDMTALSFELHEVAP